MLAFLAIVAPVQGQENGLITRPRKYSVAETTSRLVTAIEASGSYKLFWQLDHAANVGLDFSCPRV